MCFVVLKTKPRIFAYATQVRPMGLVECFPSGPTVSIYNRQVLRWGNVLLPGHCLAT